ncbi:hypothetical protein D1872_234630 [compost metagenome]
MTQPFLDPFDQTSRIPPLSQTSIQYNRELARKPTDCPRNIHIRYNSFPSMALQVDQHPFRTRPVIYGFSERSQQQVIHFRVVCAMSLFEQLLGFLLRPADRHNLTVPKQCIVIRKILRQRLREAGFCLFDMLPVSKLPLHRRAIRIGRQLLGPYLE